MSQLQVGDEPGRPSAADLARAFGLVDIAPDSLSRFATVRRARTAAGADVVVKRIPGGRARAVAMARWTRALVGAGLPVVTPTDHGTANPARVGEDWWVLYPFVAGEAYAGTADQITRAGDLLGRMHAARVPTTGLRTYDWPDTEESDVEGDLGTLERVLTRHGAPELVPGVAALGRRWWQRALPLLREREGDLVRTGVSSDYKANNLVFAEAGAVLVDPDNGGVEPRLFDLALAAVLFHNECDGAPGRLFTEGEWARFVSAYQQHVELTAGERALWPAALDHMFWEEGSWALEDNDDAAWADPRQRAFLLDLAGSGPDRYQLPAAPRMPHRCGRTGAATF